jgi:hypothetical protein
VSDLLPGEEWWTWEDWEKGHPVVYLDDGTYPVWIIRGLGGVPEPVYLFGDPTDGFLLGLNYNAERISQLILKSNASRLRGDLPQTSHRLSAFKNLFNFLFKRHRRRV